MIETAVRALVAAAVAAAVMVAVRRHRVRAPARLTPPQRRHLERVLPWLPRLDLERRAAWERQTADLLARVSFEGCGGLDLRDDMRLLIAGEACLLSLGRPGKPFRRLSTVLVYPEGFRAPTAHPLGSNVVIERHDDRIGESWQRGQVVLAWAEIDPDRRDRGLAGNLIYHEFAHQLDAENGEDDGVPFLERRLRREWQRVMGTEYRRLCRQVRAGEDTLLDPYGTESPAEFFAVATEAFFEDGEALERQHADLYRLLKSFYGVDGASLSP